MILVDAVIYKAASRIHQGVLPPGIDLLRPGEVGRIPKTLIKPRRQDTGGPIGRRVSYSRAAAFARQYPAKGIVPARLDIGPYGFCRIFHMTSFVAS